jgi:hypothetical protein
MERSVTRRARGAERGIALALVLSVLVCLLAVAIPFTLSMRHEQGGVAFRSFDEEARRSSATARDLALAHLGDTAPDRDPTPWADGAEEVEPDLEGAAESLGGDALGPLGPRGKLLSVELEDQSGRIDLNRASLPLLARTLGLSTRLARRLTADEKEIRLLDGSFLADEGFLWIDGEITYYRRRDGSTVLDFTRPAVVPGVWEPAQMPTIDPREFEAGEEVLDFRAWMAAAWLFKAAPGRESRFESLAHPMAISRFGRGALGLEQRARLERLGTLWSGDAGRDRFGIGTRVLSEIRSGETRDLRVEQGAFVGRGTLFRVRSYSGGVDYGFVLRSNRQDDGYQLVLEMPLTIGADSGQAVIEFLLPRPVNVNACSRETLELLLDGLQLRGRAGLDERTAKLVAERMLAARPLSGLQALSDLLDVMVQKEKVLKGEQRDAVLANAEHSGSFLLETASAPFSFASDGVFDLRAAASLNWPLKGREKARAFLHEVIATAGAGRSVRAFATQRDFEEPWRVTRLARGWTTFPENLALWPGGTSDADPGSRLPVLLPPRSRPPSEELANASARLAPGRMTIRLDQADRTWHFDAGRGDLEGKDPDGWRFADGPLTLDVTGGANGVELVQRNSGITRPMPFGVSMWWNAGRDLGAEQTLFDWKTNARAVNPDLHDRVRLRFVNRRLELEAAAAFLRESQDDLYTAKIVYDFTDGLPLEADTWYHVTAFLRGNRGGQMSLWVDGRPRGKWSHHTRLLSQFDSSTPGVNKITIDAARLAEGTTKYPSQGSVRVGTEVFEYTAVAGGSLTIERDVADHFGGIRPAPIPPPPGSTTPPLNAGGMNHPAQSAVEPYGYSARLASDAPDGSTTLDAEGLGEFGVVKVARSAAKTAIMLSGTGGPSFPIGVGFEADANELEVVQLDGNRISGTDKPLQRNGGYALIVSYYLGNAVSVYDPGQQQVIGAFDSFTTSMGSYIQGVEAISYAAFDGSKLTGIRRGKAIANELQKTDLAEYTKTTVSGAGAPPTVYHFVEPHAFVLVPDPFVWSNWKVKEFTVLVVPISVSVADGGVDKHFLIPQSQNGFDPCELMQIDSGFNDTGLDSTEWVRYDALVRDQNSRWNFLRADPQRISAMQFAVDRPRLSGNSTAITGDNAANLLSDVALNPTSYAPGQASYDTLVEKVNGEDLANPSDSSLAFRGVLDTGVSKHSGGVDVYPVFRTWLADGRPGRYDEVTFVADGVRPERHVLNYAWSFPISEDWNNFAHCALLAEELATRFAATRNPGFNASTTTGFLANQTYEAESRNFARILRFPSGELPSVWDGSSGLVVADGTGEGAMVDEVRVFAGRDPQQLFSHGSHVLRREVTVQEQDRFELLFDTLRFAGRALGDLVGLEGIHTDASVWQLGDDFLVGAERQPGNPIVQELAEEGRTFLGGEPGFHEAGETAMVLPWFCMTRLAGGVSPRESLLPLADPSQFPRQGFALIDQEVVAWTDLPPSASGAQLYVPTFMAPATPLSSRSRGDAAFRGRFGTPRQSHAADAIVWFWPWRYPDGYAARCDIPELCALEIPIAARRALFHSLVWREQQSDALASLVASVRVQGRGDFAADPGVDPDFFVFERPGTEEEPNRIDRQGDLLRLRFHVRYRDGALDPVDFARNSWKRAPRLELVGVEYLADRVVELHDESR